MISTPARGLEGSADPRLGLQHVRADVAMREHGALGDPGRAAGVLQEGEVLGSSVDRRERRVFAPWRRAALKSMAPCDVPGASPACARAGRRS